MNHAYKTIVAPIILGEIKLTLRGAGLRRKWRKMSVKGVNPVPLPLIIILPFPSPPPDNHWINITWYRVSWEKASK
jgi:hypothetical protein